MDDTQLSAKSRRQAPLDEFLQRHQPIGAFQRVQGRYGIAIDVVVNVGPAQTDDQRPLRVLIAKAPDALRAAPGVQRDHQICRRVVVANGNVNVVAQFAQDSRPAHRCSRVSRP